MPRPWVQDRQSPRALRAAEPDTSQRVLEDVEDDVAGETIGIVRIVSKSDEGLVVRIEARDAVRPVRQPEHTIVVFQYSPDGTAGQAVRIKRAGSRSFDGHRIDLGRPAYPSR